MEFRILGPLEVEAEGRLLKLGGAQPRALLALLLLHANEVVPRDRLIDELWDGRPPETAATAIQVHVSQLRKALGRDVIVTQQPGYLVRTRDGELDLRRFEKAVAGARTATPAEAADLLREALALWRGSPLADLGRSFAQAERSRLEEARLAALEQRIDADLELTRHGELVPELEQLVSEHPLRERLRGQLMVALYRSGRQADALAVYQSGRRLLDEELGLEPGEELRRLERAILEQDESLSAAPGPAPTQVPTGTVTFLFTDIEGSTRLEQELGAEQYAEALATHRRLLREAFARHDGVEIDTQGDAFFVAFPTAPGALEAAVEAQDLLASGPLRVRMGLHTGTPLASGDGYVGVDVHRAARIAAAGHGGQVLISASTAALVGTDGLRDLGEHRFKDLAAPERVYQLGDGDFPQLRSLQRTNLPIPSTPFLGRERELHEVQELVSRADVRLLTLTGPGGSGKTRLALQAVAEASDRYPGGVFWVPLAPLRDPELVLDTARQAVGARGGLAEHIGDTAVLLLFDNFEHMTEAAPDVAGLLGSCARLDLLVTSREPLHVTGEQEYSVLSLSREDGVDFFTARARAVKPDFSGDDAVGEICRRLDDLPLALELAAARVKALSPAQLLERLEHRLPLLTGGARDAPERQRTLRATIEWSYDLLPDEEKSLFARLAVFRGGCTLEAVEEVASASLDVMQSLVDKSLLRHSQERFWMLATIREYAAERLDHQGDRDTLRQRHADYFLRLAEEAEPHLTGSQQAPWLERLEVEHDNFRLALDSLRREGRGGEELRLAGALMRFWYVHGHLREGSSRLEDALAAHDDQSQPRLKALFGAGLLLHRLGDYQRADALAQERLVLARRLEDGEAVATSMIALGLAAQGLGDDEGAAAAYTEAAELARAGGYTWFLGIATHNLGDLLRDQGDYVQARARLEEALEIFRELGDERFVTVCLVNLGFLAAREGRNDEAEALMREGLVYAEALVDTELAIWCLTELSALTLSKGDAERAARLTGAMEALREETGHAPTPDVQRLSEETRSALVSQLGEEQVAAALAVGREMAFEQAMAYALEPGAG